MFWFEYNFLYVLAAGVAAPTGAPSATIPRRAYAQRARFYAISAAARLNYARNVARYIVFLAENTGLAPAGACARAPGRASTGIRPSTRCYPISDSQRKSLSADFGDEFARPPRNNPGE